MKRFILFLSAIFFSLLLTTSAMAIGIGGYVDLGVGSTSWGGYSSGTGMDITPTGGLILDTAAAKNKIFNYRFKFGGGRIFSGGAKLDKVGMVHTFGLSPANLRGDEARFFFGPRIGMHYVGGDVTTTAPVNPLMLLTPLGMLSSNTETTRINLVRLDLGLVLLGFNFNLGEYSTLTFEFGFNYGVMLGEHSGTIVMPGYEGFATIGFMCRINDTYNQTASTGEIKMQVQDVK